MPDQSTFSIQVWNLADQIKQQWETDGLFQGSHIKVAASEEEDYWIWEKVVEPDKIFWRFRPSLSQQLAITYDDCNGVTMQPIGPKSNFDVFLAYHNGYIVGVPGTKKFLAVKDGKLALSHIPSVWFIKFQHVENVDTLINMTEDSYQSQMWTVSSAVAGNYINVEQASPSDIQAQWYITTPSADGSRNILPTTNTNAYVACDEQADTVQLAPASVKSSDMVQLRGQQVRPDDSNAWYILNHDSTRYFCIDNEYVVPQVSATAIASSAVAWRPKLCGFQIERCDYPADPKSTKSTLSSRL